MSDGGSSLLSNLEVNSSSASSEQNLSPVNEESTPTQASSSQINANVVVAPLDDDISVHTPASLIDPTSTALDQSISLTSTMTSTLSSTLPLDSSKLDSRFRIRRLDTQNNWDHFTVSCNER